MKELKVFVAFSIIVFLAYVYFHPQTVQITPTVVHMGNNYTVIKAVIGSKIYNLTVEGKVVQDRAYLVFRRGVPVVVIQGKSPHPIVKYSVVNTLEKLPEVKP